MRITEIIKTQRLICDGGFGTMLQAAGMGAGECSEEWNISHPDIITNIHKQYIDAGSDIITLNTFGVNTLKYSKDCCEEMIKAAYENAKRAVINSGKDVYIALDVGPLGRLLAPYGDLDFEDAVSAFANTVRAGYECGADLVIIETMNDTYETKAAVIAAKENCDLPIFVTNVFDKTRKQMTGADIRATVALLEGLGVDAIGMNCSLGPRQMNEILPEFFEYSSTPIIVQPNAGLPVEKDGVTRFDIDSDGFALEAMKMAEMGAAILGGCCGTTPEYIRKVKEKTKDIPYSYITKKNHTLVSSYTHACEIGKEPILIGERINPTGKSKLKEALRQNNMSYILSEAVTEEEKGAHILDVNVGLPEIDEVKMLKNATFEIQSVTNLPLQLDSVNVKALEAAMRIYNGKPLINSVNGNDESMDKIFPLVKKYGGVIIALTMDDNGIPNTARERLLIAKRIVERAEKYGIDRKNIVADPLALTVSADKDSAKITLEAIELIKNELSIYTSLGISNISFGLPNRDMVTAAFFTLALASGLDAAIMNPNSSEVMKAYYTYRALNGLDEGFADYIGFATTVESATSTAAKPVESGIADKSKLESAIIKGLKLEARAEAERLLENTEPMEVINSYIIPALNFVGKGYEEKRIYLPGLLMSADASQAAFEVIKEKMPKKKDGGNKIVIATVKGDIHDIGKNIVKVLLENFGFDIVDLGRDVPPERVFEAAKEHNAALVGLSALMTTTLGAMEETVKIIKENLKNTKIMVGGAVLTPEYANMIGADIYAADAMEAVRAAQRVFGK